MSLIKVEIVPNSKVNIKPLSIKREWMNNLSNAHAYNCFPLSLTNGLGWGISLQEDISFIWDGIDTDQEEGHINILSGKEFVNEHRRSATLSIYTNSYFKTDEDTTMLTMPVPNTFNDEFIPYTTLMSTSFFQYPLPIALKIIKPNTVITIKANTPIVTIIPISLKNINNSEIHIYDKIFNNEDNIKNENYAKVSQEYNKRGEWTHFYRDATDENKVQIGKHEIKSFKLKTIDYRGV